MSAQPLVEMENIHKDFGGVQALVDVSMNVNPGEVHVLLGENGAGKSTLIKILCGVYPPSAGDVRVNGQKVERFSPRYARELGVSVIHQELSTINEISVAENIFLGALPGDSFLVDKKPLYDQTEKLLRRVKLNVDPKEQARGLKISQKQMVEIAKALALEAKVIIMDEPTSSLTYEETNALFAIIRQLKKEGVGIIYISHKLDEVMQIGDRVTVLKDGRFVGTKQLSAVTPQVLVKMMVGSDLEDKYLEAKTRDEKEVADNPVVLEVRDLTRVDLKCRNISFTLKKGEVLGFFGLVGSGRTEAMRALIGADRINSGTVVVNGSPARINSPQDALRYHIGLIPEDRRTEGFSHNFPIWKNITLPNIVESSKLKGLFGVTNRKKERELARSLSKQLDIRASSIDQDLTTLSGGNQQKVVLGKWMGVDLEIFVFDEPTRGIDVGVKQNVYKIVRELAEEGKSILLVSSELPELLANSHRILVFREGEIVAQFPVKEATEEKILYAATAGKFYRGEMQS